MLPDDLPQDFLEFNARFGTDEQCREYLFQARWPDGFRCDGCGHGDAYTLRTRLVCECTACGKQHSLLAGTLFEQTKTGLARWFLAIYLVTSSKGGIAAAELQRQLGFGSYQTAWSWLHKLREAMVRPDREPLAGRVEADEHLRRWAATRQARPGCRRQDAGRRRGRGRPSRGPTPRPRASRGSSARPSPRPPRWPPTAGPVTPACRPRATRTSRSIPAPRGATPPSAARYPPRLRPRQALAAGHPPRRCQPQA